MLSLNERLDVRNVRRRTSEPLLRGKGPFNKKVLIYDYGLFPEMGVRLARDFGTVWYFCHWQSAFPKSNLALVGEGLEGIERINYFWDYVDKADLIIFPDTHCHDIVEYLKKAGYPVVGVGKAEQLELDRVYGRNVQYDLGLPTQKTQVINGLDELRKYLKNSKPVYIKLDTFRGDTESFKHEDYRQSEAILDKIAVDLGAKANKVKFISEELIEGIEPGIDCIFAGGKVLSPTMMGYEIRGGGYITKVMGYKDIPKQVKDVSDKLSPILSSMNYNFFYSTEIRVPDKEKGYLIDYTMRLAAPVPSALQYELIDNYSEVVYGLGTGAIVNPVIKFKYGGGAGMDSEWAEHNWLRIDIPDDIRQWTKLRMGCKIDKDYYALPCFSSLGAVVAVGNSVEEVISQVKERTEKIKGYRIDKSASDFIEVTEEIKNGSDNYNIKF